jgi:ABC-type branched-subunit amino acid transport system substrate-binding protein
MFSARVPAVLGLLPALVLAANQSTPVRIGVLEDAALGREFSEGAALAAAELNGSGGMGGQPIELLQVAPAHPWRDGASLTARLAFEANVIALVGPADGIGSHVAAQIATRKRIPLLSIAPEDTLTETHVPWVFRGVPGDAQQARAVLSLLFAGPAGRSATLAVPAGREGRQRRVSLLKVCGQLGIRVHSIVEVDRAAAPPWSEAQWNSLQPADVLLLWLDPGDALALLREMEPHELPPRMAASTRLDDPAFWAQVPPQAEGMVLPVLRRQQGAGSSARRALGYDMVHALASAAGSGGFTPQQLQQNLVAGMRLSGKTGVFRFDASGNRVGEIPLARIRGNAPVLVGVHGPEDSQTSNLQYRVKAAGGGS